MTGVGSTGCGAERDLAVESREPVGADGAAIFISDVDEISTAVDGTPCPVIDWCVPVPHGTITICGIHSPEALEPGAPEAETLAKMIGCTVSELTFSNAGAVQMVGTSGTVTTLTGVFLNLTRYDRSRVDGRELEFGQLEGARDTLLALDRRDRAAHPCIGNQRADLVIAGCAILDAICDLWPVGRLRVADRGLREGILHGLMRSADRESTMARD